MKTIEDALERVMTDPAFRDALQRDPAAALDGYQLSDADRELLTQRLAADPGGQSRVETRVSKSSTIGLLASAVGTLLAGGGGHDTDIPSKPEQPQGNKPDAGKGATPDHEFKRVAGVSDDAPADHEKKRVAGVLGDPHTDHEFKNPAGVLGTEHEADQ